MEISDWLMFGGTILLAIIAFSQEYIKSIWKKPILNCAINLYPPYCHQTLINAQGPNLNIQFQSIFIRLNVTNSGNVSARNVEVILSEVERKIGNSYELIPSFSPDNLEWSFKRDSNQGTIYQKFISPNTSKICDLGHIWDPKYRVKVPDQNLLSSNPDETLFFFDVFFKSSIQYNIIEPGTYRFKILVGCENGKTITNKYQLTLTGKWHSDERRMLTDGISISKL